LNRRYLAAAAVALAGLAGAAALVVSAFLALGDPARFLAPGAGTVDVTTPGRYVIWHEYRSTFENRTYSTAPGLPAGATFTVRGPDGPPLPVRPAGAQTWKGGGVERQAVGRFDAPVAGRYTIVLDGPFPAIVIAVTPDVMGRILGSIGGAALLALLGVGTGIGLFVRAVGANEAEARRTAPAAQEGMAQEHAPRELRELRDMATLVYALYAASIIAGITLLGGVVVAYLKRADAAGTWLESHYRWQIRTFWWMLAWGAIGILTSLILVGFAILLGAAVWFVYRVAKGWLALREGKAVGESGLPRDPPAAPPGPPGQVPL
jgi:uncharacterized membrane protein